jgi:hypothetical protein
VTRTTYQQHAQIERKMINLDRADPGPMMCAWSDCDHLSIGLYWIRQCEHSPRIPCHLVDLGVGGGRHYWFHFCREKHKQYFLACSGRMAADTAERNQGRIHGMLPPGYRHSL